MEAGKGNSNSIEIDEFTDEVLDELSQSLSVDPNSPIANVKS